jgi:molybdate transport system substrate-binding protein
MRRRRGAAVVAAAALCLGGLAACGTDGSSSGEVTLRVFAAASLTGSFTTLGRRFEKEHPGVTVELNFGPSSGLAEQIRSGAPADVFASASPTTMDTVVQGGDAEAPRDFATNRMEIAVPSDNPAKVAGLADLARPSVKVALCQAQVPCGTAAAEVFAKSGLSVRPVSEEVDVKSVLTKVALGEVDAGMVYVTDVLAAGRQVDGVPLPAAQNATTEYPVATLTGSRHRREAGEFVDLVLSDEGARVLRRAGFGRPR